MTKLVPHELRLQQSQYRFSVIGNPIAHSLSPYIHQQFAKQFDLTIEYTKTQAPLDAFTETVKKLVDSDINGLNITLPFKLAAFKLCEKHLENAKLAKSVNTIIVKNNCLIGENTDGLGLIQDLTKNNKFHLENKIIVILGAGGATRGILQPILAQKPALVYIANRTPETAQALATECKLYGEIKGGGFEILKSVGADLVIDSTSFDFDPQILPTQFFLNQASLVYDLKYNPESPTPIMRWGQEQHAKQTLDGFGMLVEQAAQAFYLWTDKQPATADIIAQSSAAGHTL